MLTFITFVIILSVLVFVHELGHFLTAIRNGIRAEEFGFGFPPRIVGVYRDRETGRWKTVVGNRDVDAAGTVYSLNWIFFGGFVRIKGENGQKRGEDSFAGRPAWTRVKVLGAGVFMNFVLAWVLMSIVLAIGFPQSVDPENRPEGADTDIQILGVAAGSPAEAIGIRPGDIITRLDGTEVTTIAGAQEIISGSKGRTLRIELSRADETIVLEGIPRVDTPEGEGALGIAFSETMLVRIPWYRAPIDGLKSTYYATTSILDALWNIAKSPFIDGGSKVQVSGPVGIVYMTKEMSELGLAFLLQFTAIISINLGIFNLLPIPGLDGGRILFVLIEKLRGRAVSESVEGAWHQIGFLLLLVLMVWVTIGDVAKHQLLQKIGELF